MDRRAVVAIGGNALIRDGQQGTIAEQYDNASETARHIAALVAEGLTNKEIATQLRLSVRTAENHVLNVMNKLGLDNRAQVAAWFTRTRSTEESPTR